MSHTSRLYLRALQLRCPACGGRPVFVSWFRMCPNCPSCGLHFDREPEGGYWVGSYTLNLMLTEAALAAAFLIGMWVTWPQPPWDLLVYGDIAIAAIVPVLIFPYSKTLFIAVDLTFRPKEPEDYETPREIAPHPTRPRG